MKKYLQNSVFISIIVPIYNPSEKYLRQCIKSLLSQTLNEIEIILVNDGSTNESKQICEEYALKDDRIKIINKKNNGVSSARNVGLEIATGNYIMFVDADDWIDNTNCEIAYTCAVKNDADLVYWSYIKELPNMSQKKVSLQKYDSIYNIPILGSSCMKLYKKECLDNLKFDENIKNGEDVEFNIRVFKNIKSVKFIDEYSYHYVIHENSAVRLFNDAMIKNYQITLKKMNVECLNEKEREVFYTFSGISYLMILMNYIVTSSNKKRMFKKISQIKQLSNEVEYRDMFKNTKKVNLSFTRKIAIIFSKYHMYFLSFLVAKVKLFLDGRTK